MYNKAQLNKDRKDASKPRTLAKPKDIDYVSKMGYRDDSPFNNRPYIDINTPNGLIDMSNTGIDLIANGRFLPKYSGLHQFDTTKVREIPVAQMGGEQYVDLTDEEIEEYRRGGYVVEELPKAQKGGSEKFEPSQIYTYKDRPGSYYKLGDNDQILIKNKDTNWKYVPMKDPTGERTQNLLSGLKSGYTQPYQSKSDLEYHNLNDTINRATLPESTNVSGLNPLPIFNPMQINFGVKYNKRVADQNKLVQAYSPEKPYAIVDKNADSIFYFNPNGTPIAGESVITGASKNDIDRGLSMKDWMEKTGNESHDAYFNYLKSIKAQTTPSGAFTLGSLRTNTAQDPSLIGSTINNLFRPERAEFIRDSRIKDYGEQQKMFTLIDARGSGSSKAVHGTGNPERIKAFNTPGASRAMSNGCINVNGKTVCFDVLEKGSGMYILPEQSQQLVLPNSFYMPRTNSEGKPTIFKSGGSAELDKLPKAQNGVSTSITPPIVGDPNYDRKLKAYNRYLENVNTIGEELAMKTYKASACFDDYCPPAEKTEASSTTPPGENTSTTFENISLPVKPITEQNIKDALTPTKPEMVWIKQTMHPEKNMFGNPKRGQERHQIEKQVAAGSDEANRYFASSQHSPDSIKYFHDYPMYDAEGRPIYSNTIQSEYTEVPEMRQFTTEGAYPYGYAPTTPEQLATEQQLNVRKKGGKTLTKAQTAGTTGNNNGCPEGHWWDPTTGTCVPMPAVQYIEDENDPRYKKYLDQMNLYKYSTLDNYYKQSGYLDPSMILAGQFEQPDWKWTDYVSELSDAQKSYQDENKGYYGSQNILKTIPASELKNYFSGLNISNYGANRDWNLDRDYGQLLASNDLSKWERKQYEALKRLKEEYPPQYYRTNTGYTNYPISQYYDTNPNATYGSSNYWIKPDTQVIEDSINRDELKKIYPLLTDAQIDEWVSNIKTNPDYITNKTYQFNDNGDIRYRYINDQDEPGANASGNFPVTAISGIGTTDVPSGTKAFLPDDIQNEITQTGSYIPIWGPPSERYELRPKEPEPEIPAEPEMVWIKEFVPFERNMFGKIKKGQDPQRHQIEKQVVAGSKEANDWFRQHPNSPDSVAYFHKYPMLDAAGRNTMQHIAIGEIPKHRQFTTEGAYPYGQQPAATTPEQLATEQEIDVRRQGGYVSKQMVHFLTGGAYEEGGSASKPANRWAVTDPRSMQVDNYFPKLAEGGSSSQLYIHPDRKDAVYKKDSKGKWLIKSNDTSGKFVPLKDPDGKRAANLNKYAVPAKAGSNTSNTDGQHQIGLKQYTYANSWKDTPDTPAEDLGEIFDPTGLSSWDDVARSYNREGLSGNTMLEALGAVPLLGKLKWVGETAQNLGKQLAITGRQKRSAQAFGNMMKTIGTYAPGASRFSDGYQAYANTFFNNLGPKYQDGGNTDPGNNALELHMFYDKDVYKKDGGEIDYLTDQEIEALREQGYQVDIE